MWTLLSLYVPLAAAQEFQFPVLKTQNTSRFKAEDGFLAHPEDFFIVISAL